MASTQHVLLSPAELAFLYTSLSRTPPIRPDGRAPTQFRPLTGETGILPGANGSARICFADGTEAIVGVKAEVEKTRRSGGQGQGEDEDEDGDDIWGDAGDNGDDEGDGEGGGVGRSNKDKKGQSAASPAASSSWVEVTIEIPGVRDDDSNTIFLAALLAEALLADGSLARALHINRRFHWKLYLDILLISPPLSYPLPLLSLTGHLALLATRLPRLTSEGDEDPFFDDDWDASTFLYPRPPPSDGSSSSPSSSQPASSWRRPPITLLVMAVGDNILFDPSSEELAVASTVLAVSVGQTTVAPTVQQQPPPSTSTSSPTALRLLAIRTIDPPSRLTAPGTPYHPDAHAKPTAASPAVAPASRAATAAAPPPSPAAPGLTAKDTPSRVPETEGVYGVWRAPRGGAKVALLAAMTHKVLEPGGVAAEVFAGLDGVAIA